MRTYQFSDTFRIVQNVSTDLFPFLILRDKKIDGPEKLGKLFAGSHKIFRNRVRDLGKLEIQTTESDADALRIMLEALIMAKKKLSK
ncbi:MAG: hypothetical protein JWM20_547 [Patescibacteria group bacterium]|nr:hypothetical protein [Patescibacteria group bacterium]